MRLPAFFGHKRSINLLPRDSFESSAFGVILEWLLVFGKWAVIITQLVVIGAFLYRFTLDRKLTDINKVIARDVAVIKSYEQIERDFVLAQKQILQIKQALASQTLQLRVLSDLQATTPSEVWYDRIALSPNSLALTAYAASLPGFGQLLVNVQANPLFEGVRIGKIESSTTKGAALQFDISMTLIPDKKETKK